ncbi:MAG: HdeD family acid-resistance protein [Bacteroidota bacterium]
MLPISFGHSNLSYANGVLAILFGLIAILFPDITLVGLAIAFAVAIMLGGIFLTFGAIRQRKTNSNWPLILLEGILGIIISLVILIIPKDVAAFFVIIMGIWALIIGVTFISFYFRKAVPDFLKLLSVIAGVISVIVGLLILFNPFETTRVIVVIIGIYAIVFGTFSLVNTTRQKRR